MRVNSGRLVYQIKSGKKLVEVREIRKIRWLHFGNGLFQTILDLNRPHRLMLDHMPVMLGVLNFIPTPRNILLLGLGGAALVHYLQHYYPDTQVIVVEINQQVIDTAIQYFYLPTASHRLTLINADAEQYLTETNELFDIIILDIFSETYLPTCCHQASFYQMINQHLQESGVLTANLLCKNSDEFTRILEKIRQAFKQQTLCFPVTHYSNLIVYGLKSKKYLTDIMTLMENKRISPVQFDSSLGLCAKKIGKLK